MAETLSIEVPAGKIVRVQFKPVNKELQSAKLDGAVQAIVFPDPDAATQPPAEVAVGGPDGLYLDIKLPEEKDSLATIEVKGDPDLDPNRTEVISTIITVRRLADVAGQAISLGATAETTSFPNADQFGVFPVPAAGRRR